MVAFISVMATSKTNAMNKENNQYQFLRFVDLHLSVFSSFSLCK